MTNNNNLDFLNDDLDDFFAQDPLTSQNNTNKPNNNLFADTNHFVSSSAGGFGNAPLEMDNVASQHSNTNPSQQQNPNPSQQFVNLSPGAESASTAIGNSNNVPLHSQAFGSSTSNINSNMLPSGNMTNSNTNSFQQHNNTMPGMDLPGLISSAMGGGGNSSGGTAPLAGLGATIFGAAQLMQVSGKNLIQAGPDSLQSARESWNNHVGNNMRNWKEFCLPLAKPNDVGTAIDRARRNFSYFLTNYGLLFTVYMVSQILLSPSSMFLMVLLTIVWIWFGRKNEDPEWVVTIGGIPLGPSQRQLALFAVTMLLTLMISGGLIFSSMLCFAFGASIHACVHEPPVLTDGGLQGTVQPDDAARLMAEDL